MTGLSDIMSVQLQTKYKLHAKGTNVMKDFIFGTRSAVPANKKLSNGYTLYEWVMRMNCPPAFWGRNFTDDSDDAKEEIKYLKSKQCKIAFVFDKITEKSVASRNGIKDALKAVKCAETVGLPKDQGMAIFAQIDPSWNVNNNWMLSFSQVLCEEGYVPGYIANTDSSCSSFDRQCSHYINASKCVDGFNAVFWATEPKSAGKPDEWSPYCPSALKPQDIKLWSNGITSLDDLSVDNVYAINSSVLDYMM